MRLELHESSWDPFAGTGCANAASQRAAQRGLDRILLHSGASDGSQGGQLCPIEYPPVNIEKTMENHHVSSAEEEIKICRLVDPLLCLLVSKAFNPLVN